MELELQLSLICRFVLDKRSEAGRCSAFVRWGRCMLVCGADRGFLPSITITELLKRILCAELQESKQAARMGVEVETITPGDGKMHHRRKHIDNSHSTTLIYLKKAAF